MPNIVKKKRGRPIKHLEAYHKVTTVLLHKHVHFLDNLTPDMHFKTKKYGVRRSSIIRALIDALCDSEIDISRLGTEEEIKELFTNIIEA